MSPHHHPLPPADAPGPIRVEIVDLEQPVSVPTDAAYSTAWLVGRIAGIPQTVVEVDLVGDHAAEAVSRLGSLEPTCRPLGPVADADLPRISVVVPSIVARTDELGPCLDALDHLDYPDYEVVLVDNRRSVPDDDPLPGLLGGRRHVRSVRAPRPGISSARNVGVEAATGELIVFTDDDVQVDTGWLRAFGTRLVVEPELDAVTGLILPAELESPAQIYFERYYGGFSGERTFRRLTLASSTGPLGRARVAVRDESGREVRRFAVYGVGAYGAGANMGFRRRVLQRSGGFDLALGTGTPARGGEDLAALIDILWQGGRIGYEPAAVVYHRHRHEYPALLHQLRGNGTGFVAMLLSVISHDPRHVVGLAAQLPLAVQRMLTQSVTRLRGGQADRASDHEEDRRGGSSVRHPGPSYPSDLVKQELRGMTAGVAAYVASRRAARTWNARP